MLVNFGGASVWGGADGLLPGEEPKMELGAAVSPELGVNPGLPPNGAPGLSPDPGVNPAELKPGIETSTSMPESLASIF